jgi:hypothetical protein
MNINEINQEILDELNLLINQLRIANNYSELLEKIEREIKEIKISIEDSKLNEKVENVKGELEEKYQNLWVINEKNSSIINDIQIESEKKFISINETVHKLFSEIDKSSNELKEKINNLEILIDKNKGIAEYEIYQKVLTEFKNTEELMTRTLQNLILKETSELREYKNKIQNEIIIEKELFESELNSQINKIGKDFIELKSSVFSEVENSVKKSFGEMLQNYSEFKREFLQIQELRNMDIEKKSNDKINLLSKQIRIINILVAGVVISLFLILLFQIFKSFSLNFNSFKSILKNWKFYWLILFSVLFGFFLLREHKKNK